MLGEDNTVALVIAFAVAAVVSTLNSIEQKTKFTTAAINVMLAGFAAPTVVWVVWKEAPFFVYSLVSVVVARWPDMIKLVAERFTGGKS